ncbi:Cyclic nucleotide-gated olfactory channel [Cyphomyrmex costatus]|uniref:Cyclic nucleotide-gated olfactory channel n=1 Tax=Cyphomyrmex costatus TaxID=456900 RepID=A0A151I6P4_9HYME|nr:Cyclic nucleotide-gated olfactory channel [Cyphomyrmex costatus]
MKLRTTVQLSSAMSRKPPLKREDSFLKRFSTRPRPRSQETLDNTEGEDDTSNNSRKKKKKRSRKRSRRSRKSSRTVINPDENVYYYWLMVVSVCVLYNLWALIVRQSLPELNELVYITWLMLDYFSDVVFIMDVIVQFRTGYLEQGLMVYDGWKLVGHYLFSKFFFLDIFALTPLSVFGLDVSNNPILRFPRFLKIYRLYYFYYMVESRTVYPNFWRVLNLIHILLILAHWFGCFYYLLSEAEGFKGEWVYPYRPGKYSTLARKYLACLYWATLTLTTIGDLPTPETNAEYVFTIVSYLIGVFIFATIVGQVGNVITNKNANRLEFERLLDGAKTYMRHHKVPEDMKRRVLRWYDYSWSRGRVHGGGDINTALGLLPDKLKTELALHVNLSVLKKVTIFHECQPEFLCDLVLKMKAYIFTPGDLICRKGEVAREMFIIADGILEVLCNKTGRILTTMKAGDFFGEIGILSLDGLNKRTADVRSVGYSELFSLSREDMLTAMKDYPEAREILRNLGRKRLMEAQKAEKERRQSMSSGHDSSDNSSINKNIVNKLKSDVKGLKNVLRKRKINTQLDETVEQQPLAAKLANGRRRSMLKRQQKIDDQDLFAPNSQDQPVSPLGAGLPLLARLKLLKEKEEMEERLNLMDVSSHVEVHPVPISEVSNLTKHHSSRKNSFLFTTHDEIVPEDTNLQLNKQSSLDGQSIPMTTALSEVESIKKPSTTLKNIVTSKDNLQQTSKPKILQQTKTYVSIADLSPEHRSLPFVKKLKLLNERQKLAELERTVRSLSLDCGKKIESKFDNLTRSHSETCAIEYTRKLAKYHQDRREAGAGSEQLSPENKMKAPTIEGYAARRSKLSKRVTFNKYTLQSPPSEQTSPPQSNTQDQLPSRPSKFSPVSSTGGVLQTLCQLQEEYLSKLLFGVSEIIKAGMDEVQKKFEQQLTSLELEVHQREDIISQLQSRIQQLEQGKQPSMDVSGRDSIEHQASMEEDEDNAFMRDSSILGTHDRYSLIDSSSSRSWEQLSGALELQELPISNRLMRNDNIMIDIDTSDEEEFVCSLSQNIDSEDNQETDEDDDEQNEENLLEDGCDWEALLMAQELAKRKNSHNWDF